VFCNRILPVGKGAFGEVRQTLRRVHKLPLPQDAPGPDWTRAQHQAAFLAFLRFVKINLAGQTAIRIDAHWASQAQLIQGFAEFAPADVILREDEMDVWLPALAMQLGHPNPPQSGLATPDAPFALADIWTPDIEAATEAAYARDYATFGFGRWAPAT
jgi:hypothetical protein